MDNSKSRKSDAAATRKRRSSILKNQRSVRAPLSELEFNVATPPDQAKSRRVSFSRRTGVAEFEVSEATTAWKNVYEEHNKSLETSANESGMKAAPRRVAHLGGRAAHFSDDEADAIDAREREPEPPPRAELSQLAHTHDTVQLFRLDSGPGLRELTDNLHVDFSAVDPLGDDLDVLRQDLDRDPLPANVSEYSIDVDFNATHFTLKADDDDMSITDTIRSPTVTSTETRSQVDWTADKENIVVNPYVAPKASDNFAVSDDGEDILVFDGKKCKFQSNLDLSDDESKPSRTVVYDDASDMSVTQAVARVVLPARDEVIPPARVEKTVFLDNDITVTGVVPAQILPSEVRYDIPSRTVVYDDAAADMSVTQAVARVIMPRDDVIPHSCVGQKTVLLDDDMAVTRPVPAQIFQSQDIIDDRKPSRTVVYDDTAGDMSVTQAIERLLLPQDDVARSGIDQKTVLDDDMAMTCALLSEPNATRRKTVVFGNDDGNISVTQAVPTNIINAEIIQSEANKESTKYGIMADMSVTQAVPSDLIQQPQRRKTIVFGDDDGHISMTEAVPAGALLPTGLDNKSERERRRTIVYNNEDADISITGVVPANIHEVVKEGLEHRGCRKTIDREATNKHSPEKEGMSIVWDGNISVTQTEPSNIIVKSPENIQEPNKPKSTVKTMYFEDMADKSIPQAVPTALVQKPQRRKTILFEDDDGHISMTEAVPAGALLAAGFENKPESTERRRTSVYNNEHGNISVTGVVTTSIRIAKETDQKCSPEKEASEIYSFVDSLRPQISPGSSPVMSLKSPNASLDFTSNSFKLNSLGSPDCASIDKTKPNVLGPASQRASILDALLDMSQASEEALAIEYVPQAQAQAEAQAAAQATASNITIINTVPASNTTLTNGVSMSESYIVIGDNEAVLKDDEVEDNVSKLVNQSLGMEDIPERPALEGSQPLPLEYKKEKHGIVCKLQHKLSELKDLIHFKEKTSPKKSPKSITYSNTTEADKNSSVNTSIAPPESSVDLENLSHMNNTDLRKSASPKHEKTAEQEKNKTLSINLSSSISMHDKESSPVQEKNECLTSSHQDYDEDHQEPAEKEQSQWTGQADDTRAILDALSDFTDTRRSGDFQQQPACANKSRRSSAPDRKSMVISREDMLREISMAQAIMKTEMQQTEAELTEVSSDEQEATPPRLSGEVVKTLRFEDDDSIIEPRVLQKSVAKSPPRRASPVIPAYDVSEHVKELVHDLIKPMADVAPQCLPEFSRDPSRGSQVDNFESSQIDLIPSTPVLIEPRRTSCIRSPEPAQYSDIDLNASRPVVVEPRRRSCLRSPDPVAHPSEMHVDKTPSPRKQTPEPAVIVFDHLNPLNNVLLPPVDQTVVHKYNPRRSDQSLSPSLDSQAVQTDTSEPKSRSVDCGMVLLTSTVDRGVASERSMRDTEANTSIVMKGNRELLAASSSLTLVDDALARSAFDVSVARELRPRSPVRVIFKLEEPYSSVRLDSELTSCASSELGGQKRGHTASKGPEVTPKPAIKVQKVSTSSKAVRRLRSISPRQDASPSEGSRGSSGSVSTVAALWACARSSASSGAERADWRPELMHEPSSKNLACEQDPGVNVVAKIDVLPFMGTSECEWESRAADTWSFRLLRSRLRLLVRLEHRACNTTRAAVRADTPVRLVLVQHARQDSDDDPVAALCLCLAAEALQRVAARGCARAGVVPGLLRRCAAIARVALRWGRAMRAARAVLAFSLKEDGLLSLKVANVPLRSVWEVRLRVELCDAGRGAPWPRAAGARVLPVVAAWAPGQAELDHLLDTVPEDWGHVPRTVWKIFKYLKNKRPEDDLLTA